MLKSFPWDLSKHFFLIPSRQPTQEILQLFLFFRRNEEANYDRMNEKWTRAVRTQSNQANCLSTTFSTGLSNCFVYNLMRNFDSQKRVTFLSALRLNGTKWNRLCSVTCWRSGIVAAGVIETYLRLFLFIIFRFVCRQVIMRLLRTVYQSLSLSVSLPSISFRACDLMYGSKPFLFHQNSFASFCSPPSYSNANAICPMARIQASLSLQFSANQLILFTKWQFYAYAKFHFALCSADLFDRTMIQA